MENKYFYCYSYKLMRFLKLQGEGYIFKGKHPNGNSFWAFPSSPTLNNNLSKWNTYKQIFLTDDKEKEDYNDR